MYVVLVRVVSPVSFHEPETDTRVSTWYLVIAEPPSLVGGCHDNVTESSVRSLVRSLVIGSGLAKNRNKTLKVRYCYFYIRNFTESCDKKC